MIAPRSGGQQAAAQKYDVLTLLGVVGLGGPSVLQTSMLRLMTLITARYNWRTGEITVGRREIARLWSVDERTVKREMARLRSLGFILLRRPGVRGRVAAYTLDFDAIRAACDCDRVGPDFVARITGATSEETPSGGGVVVPFRQAAATSDDYAPQRDTLSEWTDARERLRSLGEAVYSRWIAPLERARRQDGKLTLEAPSRYHASYVERTYFDAILRALNGVDPTLSSVRIISRDN